MKIYVASSWRNPHQPTVVQVLRSAGHECYDFRNPDPDNPDNKGFRWTEVNPDYRKPRADGRPEGHVDAHEWRTMLDHPISVEGFRLDFSAMQRADVVVFVLPAGRSASWETGWCMGQGKPAIVVALEPTEPELMFREARIVGSLSEMLFELDLIHQARRIVAWECKTCSWTFAPDENEPPEVCPRCFIQGKRSATTWIGARA